MTIPTNRPELAKFANLIATGERVVIQRYVPAMPELGVAAFFFWCYRTTREFYSVDADKLTNLVSWR